jgi:hypothetical protein
MIKWSIEGEDVLEKHCRLSFCRKHQDAIAIFLVLSRKQKICFFLSTSMHTFPCFHVLALPASARGSCLRHFVTAFRKYVKAPKYLNVLVKQQVGLGRIGLFTWCLGG